MLKSAFEVEDVVSEVGEREVVEAAVVVVSSNGSEAVSKELSKETTSSATGRFSSLTGMRRLVASFTPLAIIVLSVRL